VQVWDGISDSRIVFSASSTSSSQKEMARLIEIFNLQRALLRRLEKLPEVTIVDKTKVASIDREDHEGNPWPIVSLADGRQLRARLLASSKRFCLMFY
jgi:ubiquinone biosynthesis monooxygenase Coq6